MRILIAQLNYKIGDFKNNFEKIQKVIKDNGDIVDLIVFSELCLSGYYPWDMIANSGFIKVQNEYLKKIVDVTKSIKSAVLIGHVDLNIQRGKPNFNGLSIIKDGKIIFKYHKRVLATYDVFDEDRHFERGEYPGIWEFDNKKIGILICEDGWGNLGLRPNKLNPIDDLKSKSLDFIICINGSPANVGKQEKRIMNFAKIAVDCDCPVIYTSQIGANDGIVFDGASFVLDNSGNILGCLKNYEEDNGILFIDNKQINLVQGFNKFQALSPEELFYQQIILGIKDYVEKCNMKGCVVGVSGGIDSALVLSLAVKAIGNGKVVGLNMPSNFSSPEGVHDAQTLCETLKIRYFNISIEEEFRLALKQFTKAYNEKPNTLTEQNIQSRIRGRLLMEFANQNDYIVLSTSNKSELATGYGTLYGDMIGALSPIGDLYKTEVYKLVKYYNKLNPEFKIPKTIINRAPSAELKPNQKDIDYLPDYEILDAFLKLYLELDLLNADEILNCRKLLKNADKELLFFMRNMVDFSEFKRKQFPPIIKLHKRTFGIGRIMPISANFDSMDINF